MASVSVVSPLSVDEQAQRLRDFAREHKLTLADGAAATICASLNLARPSGSSVATRRLRDALAAHGVHITQTVGLECLARLCGGPNWMRTRQLMLALETEPPASARAVFCLQPQRYDDLKMELVLKPEFSQLAANVMELLRATWPAQAVPALCQVTVAKKTITLEFEHPVAPWLVIKTWGFTATEGPGDDVPELLDLPHDAVHRFVANLERALEYQFPGLLVLGGTRCQELGPDYFFAPVFTLPESGFRQECASAMDTVFWLGACTPVFEPRPDGSFALRTEQGELVIMQPSWTSQETGTTRLAPLEASRLQSILNRMARVQRLSGMSLTALLANGINGRIGAEDAQMVDRAKVQDDMERLKLPPLAVAQTSGQPLNVVLRLVKYGYAPVHAIPAIAQALGHQDPNELLPEDAEQSTGLRVETGESFLQALRKTHVWRRVLGNSIQGEEAEEINGIGESLQEYVEVLQFSESSIRNQVTTNDPKLLEPIDEKRLARDVQELLDELTARGIAVVVSWGVRFMKGSGELTHMDKFPLRQGTIFLEKVEHLRKPQHAH